jgi:hypothetical protein
MKAKTAAFVVVALVLVAMTLPVSADNGAPSGPHYNLNIIGVPKDKNPNLGCGSGHRIFVDLGRKGTPANTKIMLKEGDDFAVLDCDGTDGEAKFQLPNPDPGNTGTTVYSVYARALGKPGGAAVMFTCATYIDPETFVAEEVCSLATLELNAHGNNNKFENVSKELLYIYVDLDGNGVAERYPLFDEALEDYFWSYNNEGLKLLQLRFYPGVQTTVPGSLTPP